LNPVVVELMSSGTATPSFAKRRVAVPMGGLGWRNLATTFPLRTMTGCPRYFVSVASVALITSSTSATNFSCEPLQTNRRSPSLILPKSRDKTDRSKKAGFEYAMQCTTPNSSVAVFCCCGALTRNVVTVYYPGLRLMWANCSGAARGISKMPSAVIPYLLIVADARISLSYPAPPM